ncbi:MAG: acetyltransferase [Cyclobacteriaceae bacterium]
MKGLPKFDNIVHAPLPKHSLTPVAIIGYSGHAYVVCDLLQQTGRTLMGYCEGRETAADPFTLTYLGSERDERTLATILPADLFVAIGNNIARRKVQLYLAGKGGNLTTITHPGATISPTVSPGTGTMAGAGVIVNALAVVGKGVILNTGCIVEHECRVGDFAHIGPGAVLAGNVTVGNAAFIGANAVVKEGLTIGEGAVVGAGTVVIADVPPGVTVAGNPQRKIGA